MTGAPQVVGRILSILGFVVTLFIWRWAARQSDPTWVAPLIALAVPLFVFPITWIGRSSLDHHPTPDHTTQTTRVVHFLMMIVIGTALISAVVAAGHIRWRSFPFPSTIGGTLTAISGAFVLLTVVNLAVRGLGAPWAISLSRRLATDWLYARTRNPMVFCLVLFLFCLGLQLRSALFLAWVALVLIPAMTVFLHFYEERELEIRFGASYRQYRSTTPMFFPRLRH